MQPSGSCPSRALLMTDRTQSPEPVSRVAPLRSVWLAPRDTIEQIVRDPRRSFLPLAIIGGIAGAAVALVLRPASTDLLDWRLAAIVVVVGATLGPLVFYIFGLTLRWTGRLLGGAAPAASLRAAAVWGALPTTVAIGLHALLMVLAQLANASLDSAALAAA